MRGFTHELGNIKVDESKSITIEPGGDSNLEIEFTTDQGQRKKFETDFRLESDYKGFILIRIENDLLVHTEKDYFVSWF